MTEAAYVINCAVMGVDSLVLLNFSFSVCYLNDAVKSQLKSKIFKLSPSHADHG